MTRIAAYDIVPDIYIYVYVYSPISTYVRMIIARGKCICYVGIICVCVVGNNIICKTESSWILFIYNNNNNMILLYRVDDNDTTRAAAVVIAVAW